ncbi:MAG TPA: apolipoprotein N-acyltransferase [Phycisphaerae bacterium]|nr:apolipoprotein N-acyltransferase [Phycisphaerae bacterium]HRY69517.1 apolipoprotein N-acyltransferase [Phycisphaerae bacterium]HSA28179.1 apolipoprotein N-acyltransferase [Phycisphaerae bacterium]
MKRRRVEKPEHTGRRSDAPSRELPSRPTDRPDDILRRWPVLVLAALTWLLTLPLFEPQSWWPLGFIAFVPWIVATCATRRTRWMCFVAYLLGTAYFLMHLRWLGVTTSAGHVAASLYLAVYFVPAAWAVHHMYRRRHANVVLAFAMAWTALELIRSRGPLAFPWFLLGHSQIRLLPMIQVADLAGVGGVTFVLAAVNGLIASVVLRSLPDWKAGRFRLRQPGWPSILGVAGLVLATLVYGQTQLGRSVVTEGPRVSVVQGDFLLDTVSGYDPRKEASKAAAYFDMVDQAASSAPDMIVLPETPWAMILNYEARQIYASAKAYHKEFVRLAQQRRAYITVGAMSVIPQSRGSYPEELRHNSAFVYSPSDPEPKRYDKIHLVPFGEFVPFRHTRRLFWLYRFLNDGSFNPWGRGGNEYSLTPGRDFATFPLPSPLTPGRDARFGITICYEDVIPHVFRGFVTDPAGHKKADFMLNISNDGWFGRGEQQPQHLVNCAFRAVENRVAVARSVNTGVSGFINSDGSWHNLVSDPGGRPRAGGTGFRVARIPLDPRVSFYSRYGDVFSWLCAIVTLGALVDSMVLWMMGRRASRAILNDSEKLRNP